MNLRLFSIAYPVTALGPGRRLAIWVAGCKKRCQGCISVEMQPLDAGRDIDIPYLVDKIINLSCSLEGITISGGEPFLQAKALAYLLRLIKRAYPNWSVIVYSGYTLRTLQKRYEVDNFIKEIDILIDGPYRENIESNHPLAGSGNQRVHALSAKGQNMIKSLNTLSHGVVNLGVTKDHWNMLIGIPSSSGRGKIHQELFVGKD